jgi:hypothetical protein
VLPLPAQVGRALVSASRSIREIGMRRRAGNCGRGAAGSEEVDVPLHRDRDRSVPDLEACDALR